MPRMVRLVLQYEGTRYVGWQRQQNGISIQGLLEDALARIEGHEVRLRAAGRTDAGVHALGQVASVEIDRPIDTAALRRALNALLPADVRVVAADEVAREFDARAGVRAKTYTYLVAGGDTLSPFLRRFVWHLPQALSADAMAAAATTLVGRHDFAAFQSTGGSVSTTVRTLYSLQIDARPEGDPWTLLAGRHGGPAKPLVVIAVRGDGFLRHMVRTLVGTLVEVGLGRRAPEWVGAVLASRDRSLAGVTAPPQGLFLASVEYAEARSPGRRVPERPDAMA